MEILKLLEMYGLDTNNSIKIVRHQDPRLGVEGIRKVYENNELELYQSYQEKDKFEIGDYLISSIGIENCQSLFVGVYKVKDKKSVNGFPSNCNASFKGLAKVNSKFKYTLEKINKYEDLKGRVIINFADRTWCQNAKNKSIKVVQILPKGYVKEFPGYLDFILTYQELKNIIDNKTSNKVWHDTLSNVAGIYLIVDKETGLQYVGSAYGKDGILGRWKVYAQSKHGNNNRLIVLINKDPDYADNFRFTILQTMSKSSLKNEVIAKESFYKEKLGSRAFGLNSN
ncbi:GIY-YIG nuclease family protein [Psychrobacillus vulpis]|uniref:GIY-YIG nuclease family protein n=1 Tax=Psychrobacillus vulpis TaxID=2325572 RepID=A0A544TR47_9BACI|nr:GIY-YIG nuclease family protein [Psychrobacillus vulpis]TQR19929.1 GIY-YIG nuclease family protein [Psychrobacillus vulpis]